VGEGQESGGGASGEGASTPDKVMAEQSGSRDSNYSLGFEDAEEDGVDGADGDEGADAGDGEGERDTRVGISGEEDARVGEGPEIEKEELLVTSYESWLSSPEVLCWWLLLLCFPLSVFCLPASLSLSHPFVLPLSFFLTVSLPHAAAADPAPAIPPEESGSIRSGGHEGRGGFHEGS